ncbi:MULTISPECIES: hypothetical protein [Virgibacillus]|uniref:Uncharacterized protein n=2 Tax=Virgibacillus TaxID=84406 RepID=A0A024QI39_9BACI|nr:MULTISPECIES: hypothetical protein [Virgibacillus]EQB34683.1 hypothetical protein M948_20055 [Virgibacillus sp. CM-4]GGJ63555.1 hypothetical protein GCM10007111_26900 [Virgibacillus kapii]CDQ41611.1 hypothetical protein BN990_03985 [Virgibacillus massiliensis]
MKEKKLPVAIFTALLSTGLLFGCGTTNDEQEPDPSEEPTEQQQDQGNELEEEQNQ